MSRITRAIHRPVPAVAAALALLLPATAAAAPGLTAAERRAAARIGPDPISADIRFLSDDLLEGRGTGTRGDEIAIRYLATQLEAAGLKPGVPAQAGAPASWTQNVPLVRLQAEVPATVELRGPAGAVTLSTRGGNDADLIVHPWAEVERISLRASDLVFVGYGITAPEYGWDDYRGADVRGKVVVVLNDNPPFKGEGVRLWYGRWDYKYENAARHGAAAAIIVHTTPSAGYPWQVLAASADGTETALAQAPGEPRLDATLWITEAAARKVFALAGQDLDERTRAARDPARKGNGASPLPLTISLDMPVARRAFESANVVGLVPGRDAALAREYVVFGAHHDHLGRVEPVPPATDGIYNGAIDNASGCAVVLAMARAAVVAPPRRSLLFVFFTAEEKGLLGARWFALHPPVPRESLVAVVNSDMANVWGRTRDVSVLGLGRSTLDATTRAVAAALGRTVHGDPFPDRGYYYRSDHFELARIGVPDLYVRFGREYVGRPPDWATQMEDQYIRTRYHQPSDEYPPSPERWDLSGAVEDARFQLLVGLRVANGAGRPRQLGAVEGRHASGGAAAR